MINTNNRYKRMSKEILRRKMKEANEFKAFQNELISKNDELIETSDIEYVPKDWLKEQGIIVGYLTEKEEQFVYVICGPVIRGEKITDRQNNYLSSIIDKCKTLKKLDTSPVFKEYRKERDKLREE